MQSPLLKTTGAVAGSGLDADVAAHYGDPYAEQRALAVAAGLVDRSHRGVLRITGADRLSWLHSLTTQRLDRLLPGEAAEALILSPTGHIEHHLTLTDDGTATWVHVEPGTAAALLTFLESMRFMLRVEPGDVTDRFAVLTLMGPEAGVPLPEGVAAVVRGSFGIDVLVQRDRLGAAAAELAGRGPKRPAWTPTTRCGSRRTGRGSAWTPTTGPSRTRSAGSAPRCTWTRAATAARRRWPGCITSATRPGGSSSCTWTAARTGCPATGTRSSSKRRRWAL